MFTALVSVPSCYVSVTLSTWFYKRFKSNSCKPQLICVQGKGVPALQFPCASGHTEHLPAAMLCPRSVQHRAPVRRWLSHVRQHLSCCLRKQFCTLYMPCGFSGVCVLQHSLPRHMKGCGASLRKSAAFSYCRSRGQAKSGHLDYFSTFPLVGLGRRGSAS